MKLRHPGLIRWCAWMAAGLIRVWMGTVRGRGVFLEGKRHPVDPRKERFIYVFWHEALLFPTKFSMPAHVLISRHADGELIAQACQHLGIGVVRGSTTRGGSGALWEMIRRSQVGHLVVTPDGPRGPRRRIQPGVIQLASLTGLPIVGLGVAYNRAWRAKSWDRFLVPCPFSLASCAVTPALRVPPRLGKDSLEEYRCLLETQLLQATQAAEQWAHQGIKPQVPPPPLVSLGLSA